MDHAKSREHSEERPKAGEPHEDIEESLDEFFTNRLTLRLMISHIQALNANKTMNSDGEADVGKGLLPDICSIMNHEA